MDDIRKVIERSTGPRQRSRSTARTAPNILHVGCLDATQFVGVMSPGPAPTHSHSSDEIVYMIDGEGILHLGGQERVIGPGSARHLPPLAEHCLEHTGKGSMRVLGVFHASGDPASRAYESE